MVHLLSTDRLLAIRLALVDEESAGEVFRKPRYNKEHLLDDLAPGQSSGVKLQLAARMCCGETDRKLHTTGICIPGQSPETDASE